MKLPRHLLAGQHVKRNAIAKIEFYLSQLVVPKTERRLRSSDFVVSKICNICSFSNKC
jgi:hypothetical protein